MGSHDWNRTAVLQLILDAEQMLAAIDDALKVPDPMERARAMRNGRRSYKQIQTRRRSSGLTSIADAVLDQLSKRMRMKLGQLRESLIRPWSA
jgi:hypothetical protein